MTHDAQRGRASWKELPPRAMSDQSGTVSPMQSEQAKRLSLPPWPKMSDTFVDYAKPIIDRLPPGYGLGQLRRALLIASGVWNAVVAERGDIDRAVEFVTRTLAEESKQPVPPGLLSAIETLAVRKLARFEDDDRIVTGVEVQPVGDRFRVLVSSESPPPAVRVALWLRRLKHLVDDGPS